MPISDRCQRALTNEIRRRDGQVDQARRADQAADARPTEQSRSCRRRRPEEVHPMPDPTEHRRRMTFEGPLPAARATFLARTPQLFDPGRSRPAAIRFETPADAATP